MRPSLFIRLKLNDKKGKFVQARYAPATPVSIFHRLALGKRPRIRGVAELRKACRRGT